MSCSPSDVSVNIPDGPSGPSIPGFGKPFSLNSGIGNPLPDGFPEDLLGLLDKLSLLIPPGALKSPLNPNFGKDVFDSIMKLLDIFMPFLMLYKFFLPILNLIICIIEVLCALTNPIKLIRALNRLFRVCIPEFLNLFPIFALIIMIISLLLLILALIEYIVNQIIIFIKNLLRNIIALGKAMSRADGPSVLAIANKLGAILCIFQNLFVLFAIFNIIIQIIKDMLSLVFSIPPCEDGDPSNADGCCTPDVCPAIVKTNYERSTGTFQYLNKVSFNTGAMIPGFGSVNSDLRQESWQLFDGYQSQSQQFRNIFDAYDVTISPKPIFFPTDAVYSAITAKSQAPYTIDLNVYYNPAVWGRDGYARRIIFKDCIVTAVPSSFLINGDLSGTSEYSGVITLAGGKGYESDGINAIYGYAADGTTPLDALITNQATLENFIHRQAVVSTTPSLSVNDADVFTDVIYTFKPNIAPLLNKNIVTLGCAPDFAINRKFMNEVIFSNIGVKTAALQAIVNGSNFPDPAKTQQCLATAVSSLRANMTVEGVAQFGITCNLCLNDLKDKTNAALGDMVGIGVEPCKSVLSAAPTVQFTTQPITVTVNLNEKNGLPITNGLSTTVGADIASRLTPHITFGQIDNFAYDGYQLFTANLSSPTPGSGILLVSFDNNTLCTDILPTDITIPPSHTLQEVAYQFIYAPIGSTVPTVITGSGDSSGAPRRNIDGSAIDGSSVDGGGKDGV